MSLSATREDFDEWMVQVYVPVSLLFPYAEKASCLWDQQGKKCIEFAEEIAVNALGHMCIRRCARR